MLGTYTCYPVPDVPGPNCSVIHAFIVKRLPTTPLYAPPHARPTRMTTQPPHSPETSSGTNLIADSRITMYKVVTSAFVNAQDVLDPGVILMWMDIAACLAAERHTKTSSVTLSMDDLHFDTMVRLGATVRLEATLHKVFGTSMEVGCTVSTSQPSGRDKFVCAACFTFVALGTDGKKMRVAEALAVTPEEKFLSTIATEALGAGTRGARGRRVEPIARRGHRGGCGAKRRLCRRWQLL